MGRTKVNLDTRVTRGDGCTSVFLVCTNTRQVEDAKSDGVT